MWFKFSRKNSAYYNCDNRFYNARVSPTTFHYITYQVGKENVNKYGSSNSLQLLAIGNFDDLLPVGSSILFLL